MGAVLVTEGRNSIESEQDWKVDFTIRQGLIPPFTTPVTKLFPDRTSTVVGKFLIPCKHPGSPVRGQDTPGAVWMLVLFLIPGHCRVQSLNPAVPGPGCLLKASCFFLYSRTLPLKTIQVYIFLNRTLETQKLPKSSMKQGEPDFYCLNLGLPFSGWGRKPASCSILMNLLPRKQELILKRLSCQNANSVISSSWSSS